jgi:hypothetical protein
MKNRKVSSQENCLGMRGIFTNTTLVSFSRRKSIQENSKSQIFAQKTKRNDYIFCAAISAVFISLSINDFHFLIFIRH